MDSRQGGGRKTEAHAPFCPHPTCGPSASRVCSLAEGPGAQPHCEAGPACWPRPGPLLLHSDSDPQTGGSCSPSRAFPATCGWSGPGVVAGGRGGVRSTSANPKAVHLAANPAACGCQVWFCGQKQSVEWLLGVCFSLYTKGINHCIHPLYECPLLHLPYF